MHSEPALSPSTCLDRCRAILNYYFAASGNDSVAQMALGYRHMHGLRVPRSCQSAVLYYNPLAEQVVELARYPGSLPAVRAGLCVVTPTLA